MTEGRQDVPTDFVAAVHAGRRSMLSELWYYVRQYRSWLVVPILLMLALLGGLVTLAGSGAAPFIYALF